MLRLCSHKCRPLVLLLQLPLLFTIFITVAASASASSAPSATSTTTSNPTNTMPDQSLTALAKAAVADNDNAIEIGMDFVFKAMTPEYIKIANNDRFVKIGRAVRNLLELAKDDDDKLEKSLAVLKNECDLLGSGVVKVPTVRYGKTELQMPIVSLGCMRFQQKWGPSIQNLDQVGTDCQENLVSILKHAISLGMYHIETARGYGCSELQLGAALKQLFLTGYCKRDDLILQTKVPPRADAKEFRGMLETSFRNLKVDRVEIFSFHGLNVPEHYEMVFGSGKDDGKECCMDVIQEYKKAGKILNIGFSTHGPEDLIGKFIKTDAFDCINFHYHYFGSYTTTGVGPSEGNLNNLHLLKERDMGIFIISAFDKGGKVYEPSNKLRALALPEMEPMAFGCGWLWQHEQMEGTAIHTLVCGAARAVDLDQPAVASYIKQTQPEAFLANIKTITARMNKAKEDALGKEWLANCYKGVPKSNVSKYGVEHNQIIWCYNMIKAFGMVQFAKNRYGTLEGNISKWDTTKSTEDNLKEVALKWSFTPGLPLTDGVDYSDDLEGVADGYKEKILEAEQFVHKLCGKPVKDADGKEVVVEIPNEWKTAYNMKPWKDYPDQPETVTN